MASILITGGAGYIGSIVTQLLLSSGYEVTVIDSLWFKKDTPLIHYNNPRYRFIRGDICDAETLEEVLKEGVDYVVHMAAVVGEPASKKFPELAHKVNYNGSINLISKAIKYGIKGLIFFSTCSNYGIANGVATEETPVKPLSLYAETKVNIERYLMDSGKNLNWIICRLATAYGVSPRMRFDLTVNDFTMNAYIKKYLGVFLPYTYRPYIHVYDIANIITAMIKNFERVQNNIFNLGFNEENYRKMDIVEAIKKFIPDLRLEILKEGMDLRDYQVDFSKLKGYLDIKKTYTLKDGIRQVIELLEQGMVVNPQDKMYYNTSLEPREEKVESGIRRP